MQGRGCCAQGKVPSADLRASAQSSDVVGQEQPMQRQQPEPGGSKRNTLCLLGSGFYVGVRILLLVERHAVQQVYKATPSPFGKQEMKTLPSSYLLQKKERDQ